MVALLFDLDRTLIDLQTFTDYQAALRDVVDRAPRTLPLGPPTDWSSDTQAVMALLVAMVGDPLWTQISESIERHEWAALDRSTAMPGAADAWSIAEAGPRAVVSLLPERVVRAALDQHGLDVGTRTVIVGRRPDHRPKPAADGLLFACAELGTSVSDAVMIGDSSWDREAARAAGVGFVGVPTTPGVFPEGTVVASDVLEAVRLASASRRDV